MTDPNMRGTPTHPGNTATSTPENASSSSTKPTSAGTSAGADTSANTNTNSNKPSQPSLASRIQSSATGLARSALTGPNDYAQTLNNATQGKATSSASASSSSAGQTLPSNQTTTHHPSTSSTANNDIPQAQTIRSHEPKAGGAFTIPNLTEEEFQRAYTDDGIYGRAYYQDQNNATGITSSGSSTHGSESTDLQSSTGNWKGKHRLQDPVQLEYTTAWERATPHTQTQPPTQAKYQDIATDGADVVTLLSDPTFDPVYVDVDNPDMENELETDLEIPAPLSKEEIDILESFRRDFARSEDTGAGVATGIGQIPQGPVPISSASLIPSIDELFSSPTDTISASSNSNPTVLRDKVLSELPGSNEWIEVQERYHDEVWGYLRPALEAARAEIEEKENSKEKVEGVGHSDADGPAVRRLRMILKHMGG